MNDPGQPAKLTPERVPRTKAETRDIRERSFRYALRAIGLHQFLQKQRDGAGWILGKQYMRASCSVGANIEEAQSAESRADFIHKFGISQKEARESFYWLRLLAETGIVTKKRLAALMAETQELIAIITSIIVSAKRRR